jgi:hypothetical protein
MRNKSWGTENVPKELWVDTSKEYRTRSGKRVVGLRIQMCNSMGQEVTYPVKGSIETISPNGRVSHQYRIWSLSGLENVVPGYDHNPTDLVLVAQEKSQAE